VKVSRAATSVEWLFSMTLLYGEMEDSGRHICEAVSPGFPIIGDADDGYGNAMNAKRTVRGYARAGFGGILMEDQAGGVLRTSTRPMLDLLLLLRGGV